MNSLNSSIPEKSGSFGITEGSKSPIPSSEKQNRREYKISKIGTQNLSPSKPVTRRPVKASKKVLKGQKRTSKVSKRTVYKKSEKPRRLTRSDSLSVEDQLSNNRVEKEIRLQELNGLVKAYKSNLENECEVCKNAIKNLGENLEKSNKLTIKQLAGLIEISDITLESLQTARYKNSDTFYELAERLAAMVKNHHLTENEAKEIIKENSNETKKISRECQLMERRIEQLSIKLSISLGEKKIKQLKKEKKSNKGEIQKLKNEVEALKRSIRTEEELFELVDVKDRTSEYINKFSEELNELKKLRKDL